MKSRFSEKTKRRILILGSIIATLGLLLALLPIGIRWGAMKWLNDQGVVTQIEDIDLNLFTGQAAISNAHGENAQGQGFSIEHALVDLNYWPLFSKQIYISDVELRNSRVDVRVDEDGKMNVAGLAIEPGEPEEDEPPVEDSTPWGFGLDRADIGELTLRYEQPGFKRDITLSSSATSDVATWEPNEPFPIDATLGIGDSRIELGGTLKPFGTRIVGDITVNIRDFALDLVAPLAKQADVNTLAGVVNTELKIALDYQAEQGLNLGIEGEAGVTGSQVTLPDLRLKNADLTWNGNINAKLLQQDGNTDQVNANGHLNVGKLDLALPKTLAFRQTNTDWQGNISAQLGEVISINADGALKLDATHLNLLASSDSKQAEPPKAPQEVAEAETVDTIPENETSEQAVEETVAPEDAATEIAKQQSPTPEKTKSANRGSTLVFDQARTRWKGKISANLDQPLQIKADGNFSIADTQLDMPGQLDLAQDSLNWQGKIDTTLKELGAAVGANGKLTTNNTQLSLTADDTALNQGSLEWQGNVNMTPGKDGPSVKAKGKLAANSTDLALPASGIKLLQESLTWDGAADYAPGEPARVNADGSLQADGLNLGLAQQAMEVAGERIAWTGTLALDPDAEDIPENSELPITLAGTLDGDGVLVTDTAQSKTLARIGAFELDKIAIAGLNDIRSAGITITNIAALERAADAARLGEYPFIAKLGEINLSKLALTGQSRVALDTITINGIDGLLYRGPKASWEATTWFAKAENADIDVPEEASEPITESPTTATTAEDETTFDIVLGRALIRESRLAVDDRGVSPAFATQLSNLNFTLADLNSNKPAQGSAVDFFSALGRYGSIKADGTINPFLEPPSANITGKIKAVNLAPISGYTAQAIDRRIDQGTFSADLALDLDRGAIDADAELKLTKLRIGGKQAESGLVENKLGLPLNKILSLLRDGDGNITLDLPVGGDLENPEFSIAKIVRKAILTSLKKAVLVIYSPIKLGKGLIDLATALRTDPVIYAPGAASLDNTDKVLLDKIAKRLQKRPKTELIVCGHSVPSDRTQLGLPDPDAAVAEGQTPPTPEALAAARDELFKLAMARTDLVGDYFVEQGIAPERLVLCNPALGEPKKALPRTSLSF